jgi:hypothetical protein
MSKAWSDPESWDIVMRQARMTARDRKARVRVKAIRRSARSQRVAPGRPWVYMIMCTVPYCVKCRGVESAFHGDVES